MSYFRSLPESLIPQTRAPSRGLFRNAKAAIQPSLPGSNPGAPAAGGDIWGPQVQRGVQSPPVRA